MAPHEPVFEEASLYDSPRAVLRFLRKMLNPILRLFFNPTPVAHALAVQGRLSAEAAARETERDRRQAEWNALHYEILQRLVTEIARGSIEYSAVTQPFPDPRRNCGTVSSTDAAQSTRVLPTVITADPSAVIRYPVVISTGRIWSSRLPSILMIRSISARNTSTSSSVS